MIYYNKTQCARLDMKYFKALLIVKKIRENTSSIKQVVLLKFEIEFLNDKANFKTILRKDFSLILSYIDFNIIFSSFLVFINRNLYNKHAQFQ